MNNWPEYPAKQKRMHVHAARRWETERKEEEAYTRAERIGRELCDKADEPPKGKRVLRVEPFNWKRKEDKVIALGRMIRLKGNWLAQVLGDCASVEIDIVGKEIRLRGV